MDPNAAPRAVQDSNVVQRAVGLVVFDPPAAGQILGSEEGLAKVLTVVSMVFSGGGLIFRADGAMEDFSPLDDIALTVLGRGGLIIRGNGAMGDFSPLDDIA